VTKRKGKTTFIIWFFTSGKPKVKHHSSTNKGREEIRCSRGREPEKKKAKLSIQRMGERKGKEEGVHMKQPSARCWGKATIFAMNKSSGRNVLEGKGKVKKEKYAERNLSEK